VKRKLITLLLAATFLLSACGQTTPTTAPTSAPTAAPTSPATQAPTEPAEPEILRGGTLVVSVANSPASFNPLWKTDDPASIINQNVFNKLVTLNNAYEICPDLAKSWVISEDGLTYTFNLHENILWHDGVPFTSEDVKFSILAVQEFNGRMAAEWGAVETIDCPDDYTVILNLSRPDAALIGFLAWYANQMIPKHIYEGTDWTTNPANMSPIGTGPFKFVEWRQGVSITLERNDDYFMGAPYLDEIVFQIIPDVNTALQAMYNGEVDHMASSPGYAELDKLINNPDYTVTIRTMPSRYYLGYNFGRELMQDIVVREAIAMAIDRDEILERAFYNYGTTAYGYYTPVIAWAFNDKDLAPEYNIEKANQMLDDAGYAKGANGFRFAVDLVTFVSQAVDDMSTILKEQMKEIGVDINWISMEQNSWTPRIRQDFDFDLCITNGFHGPDPHNLWGRFATTGSGKICGPYSNPEIDRLLMEAVQLSDQTERGDVYKEVQRLMREDVCMAPLIDLVGTSVWSAKLDGLANTEEGIAAGLTFSSYALTRFNDPSMIN